MKRKGINLFCLIGIILLPLFCFISSVNAATYQSSQDLVGGHQWQVNINNEARMEEVYGDDEIILPLPIDKNDEGVNVNAISEIGSKLSIAVKSIKDTEINKFYRDDDHPDGTWVDIPGFAVYYCCSDWEEDLDGDYTEYAIPKDPGEISYFHPEMIYPLTDVESYINAINLTEEWELKDNSFILEKTTKEGEDITQVWTYDLNSGILISFKILDENDMEIYKLEYINLYVNFIVPTIVLIIIGAIALSVLIFLKLKMDQGKIPSLKNRDKSLKSKILDMLKGFKKVKLEDLNEQRLEELVHNGKISEDTGQLIKDIMTLEDVNVLTENDTQYLKKQLLKEL